MGTSGRGDLRRIPARFEELNRWHPLRPIHDDDELGTAQELASRLAVLDHRTSDHADYLEALAILIEKYEDEGHAMDLSKLSPVDTLRFLMEENQMTPADLGRVLGNRSLGYAILNETRGMSLATIAMIAKHFHVGPGVFMKA